MSVDEFEKRHEGAKKIWNNIRDVYSKTAHPVLFHGPPGTGKSAFPVLFEAGIGRAAEVFNVNKFSSKPDILGHFISTSAGSVFCYNAGARAMMNGSTLVLNEIDHGGPEIMSTFHFICDHQTIAKETVPDGKGTVLKANKGYRVVATMNGDPDNLPMAIRDRFQIRFNVTVPNPDAVMSLDPSVRRFAYCDGLTLRSLVAIGDLFKNGFSLGEAANIVLGDVSKELAEAIAISEIAA